MYQPNILIVDGGLVHIIIILIIIIIVSGTLRAAAAALYKVRSLGSIEPLAAEAAQAPNLRASPRHPSRMPYNKSKRRCPYSSNLMYINTIYGMTPALF